MGTEVKDFGLSAGGGVNATTGYFPEGQLPSTVNNGMREVMSAVRRLAGDLSGEYTATFSGQVYTLTTNQDVTALARGHAFTWIAEKANTGTATLAVNGLSAVPIKIGPSHLVAGQIVSGQAVTTIFDGTNMQLESAPPLPAFSKGNSGYYVLPGNVLVNWLQISFSSATTGSANWARAFSATPYGAWPGATTGNTARISSLSDTAVEITMSGASSGTVYVFGIGPA